MRAPALTRASGGTQEPRPTGQTDRDHLRAVADAVLDATGYELSRAKVWRIVKTFEHRVAGNGWSFVEYLGTRMQLDADRRRQLLNDPDLMRVINYADPTGEAAVRNVMRAGKTTTN